MVAPGVSEPSEAKSVKSVARKAVCIIEVPVPPLNSFSTLAVKFQTNLEIAGSPRNSFRASVENEFNGGKALNGLGGDKLTEPYQTKNAV